MPCLQDAPAAEVCHALKVHLALHDDLPDSRVPLDDPYGSRKPFPGEHASQDGVVGNEPEAEVLGHRILLPVRIEDSQREAVTGTDPDRVRDLIFV